MQDDSKVGGQEALRPHNSAVPRNSSSQRHTPPDNLEFFDNGSPTSLDSAEYRLIPGLPRGGSRCSGSRCGSRASLWRRTDSRGGGSRCGSRGSRAGSRNSVALASRGASRNSVAPPHCNSRPSSIIGIQRQSTLANEVLAAIKAEDANDFLIQEADDLELQVNSLHRKPNTGSTITPPTTQGTVMGDLETGSLPWTASSDEGNGNGEWLTKRKRRTLHLDLDDDDRYESREDEAGEDDEDEDEDGREDVGKDPRSRMQIPKLKPKCGRCPLAPIDDDSARYPNRFLHQISKTSWLKISKNHDTAPILPHWHKDLDKLGAPPHIQTAFTRKRHPVFKHFTHRKLYNMDHQMFQYKVKMPLLKELVDSLDDESINFKYRAMREDMELSRMRMIVGKKVRNRTFEDTVALVGYLKKHRFFMDLQIDILHKIGLNLQLHRFEVNEVVWRESQEIQGIYILLRGHLDLQCSGDREPIELDGDEDSIFVRGEKVLGLRELLYPSKGGPPRLRKHATHNETAVAAKVVEGLFIEKDALRSLLDAEATAERMRVLKELWPETLNMSTDDLIKASNVEQDGHPLPIHRLFNIDVFPAFHKFFDKGQKLPWDLAFISLIIEGVVELQQGMRVSTVERGTILGKEPLQGDQYHYTAVVKSETVRIIQIRVQDFAHQFESQSGVIGQLRTRAREARKHLEDKSEKVEKKERRSAVQDQFFQMPLPSERQAGQGSSTNGRKPGSVSHSPAPLSEAIMPISGIQLKTFTIEELAHPLKIEADKQLVLDMHPSASFKKLPPRRMPPIARPKVGGRTITEVVDDLAEKPTTRRLAMKRTAESKSERLRMA